MCFAMVARPFNESIFASAHRTRFEMPSVRISVVAYTSSDLCSISL